MRDDIMSAYENTLHCGRVFCVRVMINYSGSTLRMKA